EGIEQDLSYHIRHDDDRDGPKNTLVRKSIVPGDYKVRVSYKTAEGSNYTRGITSDFYSKDMQLRSGDQRITVQAPLLVTLTVHDASAPADAEMAIQSWVTARNDGSGNFIWENIPAGTYSVRKQYG